MPTKLVKNTQLSNNFLVQASMSVFHERELCEEARSIEREMVEQEREERTKERKKTQLENQRDGLIKGVTTQDDPIEIDKVRHIIVDGINKIYYNAKPHAPEPEWVELDTDIMFAQVLIEKEALEKQVEQQEQEILRLRENLDIKLSADPEPSTSPDSGEADTLKHLGG